MSMKMVEEKLREDFYVDGEYKEFLEVFMNKASILENMDRDIFETKFSGKIGQTSNIDELQYPVMTFDRSSDADGYLFDKNTTYEEIYSTAIDYFKKKGLIVF